MEIPNNQLCESCEVNLATCETDLQTDEDAEQPLYWFTCESCHDKAVATNFMSWRHDSAAD